MARLGLCGGKGWILDRMAGIGDAATLRCRLSSPDLALVGLTAWSDLPAWAGAVPARRVLRC
jgi:hypothetical protein